jgi:hypothetical protein
VTASARLLMMMIMMLQWLLVCLLLLLLLLAFTLQPRILHSCLLQARIQHTADTVHSVNKRLGLNL